MVNLNEVFDSSDNVIKDNLKKHLKHLDILGWKRNFGSTTYWIDDEYEYAPNLLIVRNFDQ